jgi:hypothetical protein
MVPVPLNATIVKEVTELAIAVAPRVGVTETVLAITGGG